MKLTVKDREFDVFLIEYVEMAEKWTTDEKGNAVSMLSQEMTEVVETDYDIYESGEYITTFPSPTSLFPPATLASYLTEQLEKHLASSSPDNT